MDKVVKDFIEEYHNAFTKVNFAKLKKFGEEIVNLGYNEKKLFIAGNGGSAGTGAHFVTDILKTANLKKPPVTINLSDNIPVLTAVSNDIDFKDIFSYQLDVMGGEGDILFIITGSGNSKNLIKAVRIANNKKMKTWGLLGFDGGEVKDMLSDYILVPSFDYGIVEGIHSVLLHLLIRFIKGQ